LLQANARNVENETIESNEPGLIGIVSRQRSEALAGRTDTELAQGCLAGKAECWETLIQRYKALIFSVPLRMGLSEADAADVFQDVCIALLDHLGDVRDYGRLPGWLGSTARREAWRHVRRNSAWSSLDDEDLASLEAVQNLHGEVVPSPEEEVIAEEQRQLVLTGLRSMPDRCRKLLTLLYSDGHSCSYAEVAAALQMPVNSVGAIRARCLLRLRKILDSLER
jgi:RNA polymerase sigma factor (sigma-70 family)